MELYNTFEPSNHLQPEMEKIEFDTLHNADFCFAVLKPINIALNKNEEIQLSKRLSPGQKALYFFWYLDAEVNNGGFIQFYWNGKRMYLPPIIEGLKLINDSAMLHLVMAADKEFIANEDKFMKQKEIHNWEPLYNNLKKFDEYDSLYYLYNHHTMSLIEKYVRQFPNEFVKL